MSTLDPLAVPVASGAALPPGVLGTVTAKPNANMLAAALAYAGRGLKVFPCRADKSPATQHGFKDATDDVATITRWWTDNPRANIGIATRPSDLVVIDKDSYKAGCKADALGALPDTYTVRTPSGGQHLYFALPASRKIKTGNNRLGAHIDVTNYVIAPPSTYNGRPYKVEVDQPVAPLPQRLLDAIADRHAKKNLQHPTTPPTSTNSTNSLNSPNSANSIRVGIGSVEDAVAAAVPSEPRTNNAALFRLARALLALKAVRPVTPEDEALAFDFWYERTDGLGFLREDREHYQEKFLYALLCAKRPLDRKSVV